MGNFSEKDICSLRYFFLYKTHDRSVQTILICVAFLLSTDLYEYRVFCDGVGDLVVRSRLFKLTFRTKFNNWWNSNAVKVM